MSLVPDQILADKFPGPSGEWSLWGRVGFSLFATGKGPSGRDPRRWVALGAVLHPLGGRGVTVSRVYVGAWWTYMSETNPSSTFTLQVYV